MGTPAPVEPVLKAQTDALRLQTERIKAKSAKTDWIEDDSARRAYESLTRRTPRSDKVTARLELTRLGVLVDGDSFLIHCLRTLPEPTYGYTTLESTFLVLRGLESFLRAHVRVYLCFFDSHAPFCRSASYSALRVCIINGLQRMQSLKDRVETRQFSSWHEADRKWYSWLDSIGMEDRPCAMILDWDFEPALHLAEHCLDRGISVVDMSTFSLTGPCPSVEAEAPSGRKVQVRADVIDVFSRVVETNVVEARRNTPVAVRNDGTVALSELYGVINATRSDNLVCVAHMIALALQADNLPLEARAFKDTALLPFSRDEPGPVPGYHSIFCRYFLSSLASAPALAPAPDMPHAARLEQPESKSDFAERHVQGSSRQEADTADTPSLRIVDLWDGRLVAVVLQHLQRIRDEGEREPDLCNDFGLPRRYAMLINKSSAVFRDELGERQGGSGGGGAGGAGMRASGGGSGDAGGNGGHGDEQSKPLMIDCKLANRILKMSEAADNVRLARNEELQQAGGGRQQALVGPRDSHYHSNRRLPRQNDFTLIREVKNTPTRNYEAPMASSRDAQKRQVQLNHSDENDKAAEAQIAAYQAAAGSITVGKPITVRKDNRGAYPLAFQHPDVRNLLEGKPEELKWDNDTILLSDERRKELGKATPEPWQLKMLEAVAQGKSLLVIAPTSSGKSWAAESAALKVLRDEDNGLIVFVQPTNALVTQTYATVQQLVIGEGLNGKQVAAYTADIRPNFNEGTYRCLVTNPQCLENLLLSPSTSPAHILTRLKLVVFDEIHTIGLGADTDNSGSTAETLERLLTMIRCPIVCLTATMPDEDAFYKWLKHLKTAHHRVTAQGAGGGGQGGGGEAADPPGTLDDYMRKVKQDDETRKVKQDDETRKAQQGGDGGGQGGGGEVADPPGARDDMCDEYEVTLQDLNPMTLLPHLPIDDATQGSAEVHQRLEECFARAIPSDPRHGRQVLDALCAGLTAQGLLEAWQPTLPIPPIVLPDAVAEAYNAVRTIWERANGEVYQARLDFQDGVAKIKSAILALDGLETRLYWDSVMAKAFDMAGIEWYGQCGQPEGIEKGITSLGLLPLLSEKRLGEDWLSFQQGSWQDTLLKRVSLAYANQGLDRTTVNRVDRVLSYAILLLTNPTTAQGAAMEYACHVRYVTVEALIERDEDARNQDDETRNLEHGEGGGGQGGGGAVADSPGTLDDVIRKVKQDDAMRDLEHGEGGGEKGGVGGAADPPGARDDVMMKVKHTERSTNLHYYVVTLQDKPGGQATYKEEGKATTYPCELTPDKELYWAGEVPKDVSFSFDWNIHDENTAYLIVQSVYQKATRSRVEYQLSVRPKDNNWYLFLRITRCTGMGKDEDFLKTCEAPVARFGGSADITKWTPLTVKVDVTENGRQCCLVVSRNGFVQTLSAPHPQNAGECVGPTHLSINRASLSGRLLVKICGEPTPLEDSGTGEWRVRKLLKADEYETKLQDLNPMSLLPSLLLDSARQGRAEGQRSLQEYYARAMPSQPRHGLQVLDALHKALKDLDPPKAWQSTLLETPDTVAEAYNAVQNIGKQANGEVYQARLDFQDGVAKIKSAILALDGLETRLYWDNVMAKAFDKACIEGVGCDTARSERIEWYGQFWRPQNIEECRTSLNRLPELSEERLTEGRRGWQDRLLGGVSSTYYKQGLDQTAVNRVDKALRYAILLLTNPTNAQGAAMEYACKVRETTLDALSNLEKETREHIVRAEEAAGGAYAIEKARFIDYSLISVLKRLMETKDDHLPSVMFRISKNHQDKLLKLALSKRNQWADGHEEFLTSGVKDHRDEINEVAKGLNRNEKHLVDGLELGIGLHRSGAHVNYPYIALVERMFRAGALKIVIATTTLALGVNMPAKSTVFLGFSSYLDQSTFHQCAGRAGRRNYEPVGKVLFVGVAYRTIRRLMTSPLAALEPQIPITPAAVLRLTEAVNLSSPENGRQLLEDTAYLALTNPLFKFLLPKREEQMAAFEQTMLNSILVSWCFHLKFGFLMPDGTPTVKGDLPHRLYYLEPRCFLMAHLLDELERSAVHPDTVPACGLKALASKGPDELKDDLYLVLIYVLWPVPTRNPVDPVPDLPGCIKTAWQGWNSQVVDLIKDYVRQQGRDIEENLLPLQLPLDREDRPTPFLIKKKKPTSSEQVETSSTLEQWLGRHRVEYQARSPFTALSGRGDSFESVAELGASLKGGIFVSDRMIPAADPPARIHNHFWRLLKAGGRDKSGEAIKKMVQTIIDDEKQDGFTANMETFQKYVKALNASVIKTLMIGIPGHVAMTLDDDDKGRYVVHELLLACREVERTLQLAQDKEPRLSGYVLQVSDGTMTIIDESGDEYSTWIKQEAKTLTERWEIHRGMKVDFRIGGSGSKPRAFEGRGSMSRAFEGGGRASRASEGRGRASRASEGRGRASRASEGRGRASRAPEGRDIKPKVFDVVVHERRMDSRRKGIFSSRESERGTEWVVSRVDEGNWTDYAIGPDAILDLQGGVTPPDGAEITFQPTVMPVKKGSKETVQVACYCIWTDNPSKPKLGGTRADDGPLKSAGETDSLGSGDGYGAPGRASPTTSEPSSGLSSRMTGGTARAAARASRDSGDWSRASGKDTAPSGGPLRDSSSRGNGTNRPPRTAAGGDRSSRGSGADERDRRPSADAPPRGPPRRLSTDSQPGNGSGSRSGRRSSFVGGSASFDGDDSSSRGDGAYRPPHRAAGGDRGSRGSGADDRDRRPSADAPPRGPPRRSSTDSQPGDGSGSRLGRRPSFVGGSASSGGGGGGA